MSDEGPTLEKRRRDRARTASVLAVLATAMSLLGLCTTGMTLIIGLPMAGAALYLAREASESEDEAVRGQAWTAIALALLNGVYQLFWLLVLLMYILFFVAYFLFIFLMVFFSIGLAIAQGPNGGP